MLSTYIAKQKTWFDKGTKAEIIDGPWESLNGEWALFVGIRNGKPDEETCVLSDFEISS